jgi:hypothetical protein
MNSRPPAPFGEETGHAPAAEFIHVPALAQGG